MEYKVLQQMRWNGKNLKRGDIIKPEADHHILRLNMLSNMGFVSPVLDTDLMKQLHAAGVQISPAVRPTSL